MQFQFTRPRGARPERGRPGGVPGVSIHAPTRGATGTKPTMTTIAPFQFTRPRGARLNMSTTTGPSHRFNSRAHAGRDAAGRPRRRPRSSFNSRAHAGRDRCRSRTARAALSFNSRAHAGRDPRRTTGLLNQWRFNSRAHAGRDSAAGKGAGKRDVSIHAPTRGATEALAVYEAPTEFQFTRPRGARPPCATPRSPASCFNSRAHAGRDGDLGDAPLHRRAVSIHAPTRGATPTASNSAPPRPFQFTRPRGARHGGRKK